MIIRKIAKKLADVLSRKASSRPVILVEGARQVGKTTLVRQVLNQLRLSFLEINLEENHVLCEKIDQCQTFDQLTEWVGAELKFEVGGDKVLFIDEAQESQKLGRFVRFMKEKWHNTQVILSGSSMARIFRDDVRYPVGRVLSLHVTPFSFEEFLLAGNEKTLLTSIEHFLSTRKKIDLAHSNFLVLLQKYLEVGGLPEVVITFFQDDTWKTLRHNLLLGYYNDFKRVFGEEKQIYFISALKATASLLGSPFKNSFVASLMDGGKNQEIITTLGQLEAWKMLIKVEQKGLSAESHYHPKRYLFDVGIAKELREQGMMGIDLIKTLEPRSRTPLGGLLENFVANILIHDFSDQHSHSFTGWKKSTSGSEIDFVIKRGSHLIPIECKSAVTIKNTHVGGIRDFMKIYKAPLGIVAGLAPFEIRKVPEGKILIVPLYLMEHLDQILD